MSCAGIRSKLPGYPDGALDGADRAAVREHLEGCARCRRELESFWKLGALLSRMEPVAPPGDLATRIRVKVSQLQPGGWVERLWSHAGLIFQDILRPLAVPATGGLVTALLVFALVVRNLLPGMPPGGVPHDLPTQLTQPARLESLAPFPAPGLSGEAGESASDTLLVEATVDARGEVVDYRILSGPGSPAVRRQLDLILLFSRFRPQLSFGRPISGGRVVLSFSQIQVKG